MSSGPRPGRPIMGQRPMFGGGSPVFARMPSYTPVTRGPDQAPPQPEPQHPGAYPQGAQGYPNPHPAPAPSYQNANPAPARPYAGTQQSAPQGYPGGNGYPAPNYAPQGYPEQGYAPQGYPAQNQPSQGYQQGSNRDASFDAGFADANFANGSFPEASFSSPNADASFPENGFNEDASFPEDTSYSGNGAYAHEQPLNLESPSGAYGQGYQGNERAHQASMAPQGGQYTPADPHRAVQPFDAIYDQPPQIALGGTRQARHGAQDFYDAERPDADFLDDGQSAGVDDVAVAHATRKLSIKGRSMFMVGSALLGAVALGGALAFAYKQSGGAMNGGEPPLVQADNRPVKEAPDQPGGKDFPHKNKLIYDRLENGDKPESEHLVPRQEEVAMPAMPASTDTAAVPAASPEAADAGAPTGTVASVDDPEGGPRRVKTLRVRPDGSVVPPAAGPADAAAPEQVASAEPPLPAAPAPAAAAQPPVQARMAAMPAQPPAPPAQAARAAPAPAPAPVQAAAEPQQVASIPAPAPPVKPKPVKVASTAPDEAAPKAAAPKTPSSFVVQVGSKQNQTEALATFADMQQKYPTLLSSYRPMVQKADLGAKGVWYRLRIGPIADKTSASKLCTQLKSQGLSDCLVMSE
jgi:hypothetical protein